MEDENIIGEYPDLNLGQLAQIRKYYISYMAVTYMRAMDLIYEGVINNPSNTEER
jgi:hypothetical protein